MLITFKSSASAKIIMLDSLAQKLLRIIGKPLGARGVIRPEELSSAIQRLEGAIAAEQRERETHTAAQAEPCTQHVSPHEIEDTAESEPLRLAQRAFPLLDMLRAAQREKADIVWGI